MEEKQNELLKGERKSRASEARESESERIRRSFRGSKPINPILSGLQQHVGQEGIFTQFSLQEIFFSSIFRKF
jgi:hypothetical protein